MQTIKSVILNLASEILSNHKTSGDLSFGVINKLARRMSTEEGDGKGSHLDFFF